jgi:hypothetical protein
MDPKSGAIAHFETEEDAKKAGYTVLLENAAAEKLLPMNRHDRRKWAAEQRREKSRGKVTL